VHTTLAGGGFGRRAQADFAVQAAYIGKRIGRPVQMTWSRESDMTQAQYRPILAARMRGGVGADGKIAGVDAHVLGQPLLGSFLGVVEGALPIPDTFVDAFRGLVNTNTVTDLAATDGIGNTPYAFENLHIAFTPIRTKLPIFFWRSVGASFTGFVMESFVDELAHAARVDPLEFRRRILPPDSRARRVLDAIVPAWNAPKAPGIGRGIARHALVDTEVAQVADVEVVGGRIKVRRVHVVIDCGLVVNPDIVRAQMESCVIYGLSAALDQEITLVDGVVQQRNFDTFPVLRMFECPEITVTIVDSDEKPLGVGEPGLPPIAPAVANAIFALTGRRLRRLPLQKDFDA
jgi:CO/xanthine dehydrogenase Mo-binding subunit